MTTLPPPKTKEFPQSSIEKKVHNLVELFAEQIPDISVADKCCYIVTNFVFPCIIIP